MKRWHHTAKSMVDAPDVVAAWRRHGMSLEHEDKQDAFEAYRSVKPEAIRRLRAAYVAAKFEEEDEQ